MGNNKKIKNKIKTLETLKFNNLGIFQSLKFLILMEKIFRISLKLSFPPSTLAYYNLLGQIKFKKNG